MKKIQECIRRVWSIFLCLVMLLSLLPIGEMVHAHAGEHRAGMTDEELSEILENKYADFLFYVSYTLGGVNDYEEDGTFCVYREGQDDLREGYENRFETEQEQSSFKGGGHWLWESETVYFAYYYPKGSPEVLVREDQTEEIKLYVDPDALDVKSKKILIDSETSKISYTVEITNKKPEWMSHIDTQEYICLVTIKGLTRENLGTGRANPAAIPQITIKGKLRTQPCPHPTELLNSVAASEPTCTQPGLYAHQKCKDCGALFMDGEKVSMGEVQSAEKLGHLSNSVTMSYDDTNHWESCGREGCQMSTPQFHTIDSVTGECSACKYHGIHIKNENVQRVSSVAANCVTNGRTEYWACQTPGCTALFKENEDETLIPATLEEFVGEKDPNKHAKLETQSTDEYHEAMCTACGWYESGKHVVEGDNCTCKVCGYGSHGELFAEKTSSATEHAWKCTVCKQNIGANANHKYVKVDDGICECKECGFTLTEESHNNLDLSGLIDLNRDCKCDECGAVVHGRPAGASRAYNTTYHWKECYCKKPEQLTEEQKHNSKGYNGKCTTCGYMTHDHKASLTPIPKKPATCTEPGYEAYYTCSKCLVAFAFNENGEEIDLASIMKLPLGGTCNWGTAQISTDKTYHYYECTNDNCQGSYEEEHSDSDSNSKCDVCGTEVQTVSDNHTHSIIETVAKVRPTCTTSGTKAYYKCSCGALFTDAEAQKQTILELLKIPATGHVESKLCRGENSHWYGCIDCDTPIGVESNHSDENNDCRCDTCGYNLPHTFKATGDDRIHRWQCEKEKCSTMEVVQYDDAGEIESETKMEEHEDNDGDSKCDTCGEEIHNWVWHYEEESGKHWQECDISGHNHAEERTREGIHVDNVSATTIGSDCKCDICGYVLHSLKTIEKVDATCETPGNDEYYECNTCGSVFIDEEGTIEITKAAVTQDKLGHVMLPTICTEPVQCSRDNCNYTEVQNLNHVDVDNDGICDRESCQSELMTYYKVTVSASEGGTATASALQIKPSTVTGGALQVKPGTEVTLTAIPYEGFKFLEWIANVIIKNNSFIMPENEVNVEAKFVAISTEEPEKPEEPEEEHVHQWPDVEDIDAWEIITPATDKQEGKKKAACTLDCGQTKVVFIPILGVDEDQDTGSLEKDAEVAPESPVEEATLDNKKSEFLDSDIFDDNEKKSIAEGGLSARVWLEINKTDEAAIAEDVKEDVKKKAQEFIGNDKDEIVITYFDADLFKQVGDDTKKPISEPGMPIEITIKIPDGLLLGNTEYDLVRVYNIIRIHKNKQGSIDVDVLGGKFNPDTKEFTFASDKFSTYAIAYKDTPKHIHVWSAWDYDTNYHWHECEGTVGTCDIMEDSKKDGYDKHTYSSSTDRTCNDCGYTRKVSGGNSGGIYYPSYTPVVTATPTPKPTATPAPTATPIPTATPVPTATPIPGVITVPTMEEAAVDENGNEIISIVQDAGTQATVKIPGVTDDAETKVTWMSTNPAVASVDETGKISMLTPGITEIVVTAVKGNVTKVDTIVVLVEEPPVYINEILEAFKNVRLGTCWEDIPLVRTQMVGETVDINFWGVKNWKKENYEYIWTTSDETIAVTDKVGKVTALKPGVVTMSLGLKNKQTGAFLNVKDIEIVIPADMENKIVLGTSRDNTFDKLELKMNQRIDINFYGVKNWKKEDYEYHWSSTEPSTVWVDEVGKITPVKSGEAIITLILVEKATGYPKYVIPATITVPENDAK